MPPLSSLPAFWANSWSLNSLPGRFWHRPMNFSAFWMAGSSAGVPKDDPAIQKALKFIGRCQNLPGKEFNDQEFAQKAGKDDKGGITYTPINPDKSPYKTAAGGLRSLGGMTYNGLKSFL